MTAVARRLRGLLFVGVVAAGCGTSVTSMDEPDANLGAAVDGGAAIDDRQAPLPDRGIVAVDAATPAVDAPAPDFDAGNEPVDAGAPFDLGRPLDGPRPLDVVLPPRDGGPAACRTSADCGREEFCSAASCDGAGRCEARPMGCATIYMPVCGCDGRTYGNTCSAAAGGMRVRERGVCPTAVDAGPGRDVPVAVDTGLSVCATIRCAAGTACCDTAGAEYYGRCYPTRCLGCCMGGVLDAGVADVPTGQCRTNADCGDRGRYCAGDGCGTAGTCQARPRGCTANFDPVCGCDGATYSNACVAQAAGARVASRGACDGGARDAGTSPCALVDCIEGQVCCDNPGSRSYGRCYDTRCLACCM